MQDHDTGEATGRVTAYRTIVDLGVDGADELQRVVAEMTVAEIVAASCFVSVVGFQNILGRRGKAGASLQGGGGK